MTTSGVGGVFIAGYLSVDPISNSAIASANCPTAVLIALTCPDVPGDGGGTEKPRLRATVARPVTAACASNTTAPVWSSSNRWTFSSTVASGVDSDPAVLREHRASRQPLRQFLNQHPAQHRVQWLTPPIITDHVEPEILRRTHDLRALQVVRQSDVAQFDAASAQRGASRLAPPPACTTTDWARCRPPATRPAAQRATAPIFAVISPALVIHIQASSPHAYHCDPRSVRPRISASGWRVSRSASTRTDRAASVSCASNRFASRLKIRNCRHSPSAADPTSAFSRFRRRVELRDDVRQLLGQRRSELFRRCTSVSAPASVVCSDAERLLQVWPVHQAVQPGQRLAQAVADLLERDRIQLGQQCPPRPLAMSCRPAGQHRKDVGVTAAWSAEPAAHRDKYPWQVVFCPVSRLALSSVTRRPRWTRSRIVASRSPPDGRFSFADAVRLDREMHRCDNGIDGPCRIAARHC